MLLAFSVSVAVPNWLIMLPFGILLLAIAFGPLVAQHHWERHYHKLCIALAGIVCLYHLFVVQETARVARAGIDYATFISVVGSFFVVSGGIHLRAKGPSGPVRNTLFLFTGALLANLIGTIGASMVLIRPWLLTVGLVLAVFFVLDWINFRAARKSEESELNKWGCDGARNFLFLFALLGVLAIVPAGWREPLMVLIALGSYLGTPERIRG